jgi:hypothetical protein
MPRNLEAVAKRERFLGISILKNSFKYSLTKLQIPKMILHRISLRSLRGFKKVGGQKRGIRKKLKNTSSLKTKK